MTAEQLFSILNLIDRGSVAAAGVPAAGALDGNGRASGDAVSTPSVSMPIASIQGWVRTADVGEIITISAKTAKRGHR